MKIVVFISETHGAMARFEVPGPKGKATFTPAVVHAATAAQARERAQAFWDAEIERLANRDQAAVDRIAKRRQTLAAKAEASA